MIRTIVLHFRKLKTYIHQMKVSIDKKDIKTRWEEDYHLIESQGLFDEYLEMG